MSEITVDGYIEEIIYRNEDNGYTVFVLETKTDYQSCFGNFIFIEIGLHISIVGEKTNHKIYGEQIKVNSFTLLPHDTVEGIRKYLASKQIKGIGQKLANRIVDEFGENTLYVMENDPKALSNIKGISESKAEDIVAAFIERSEERLYLISLQSYGLGVNTALKIYKDYGSKVLDIINDNPYQLISDISGIGFNKADQIAQKIGISKNSSFRKEAGIVYTLEEDLHSGNCYMLKDDLKNKVIKLLNIDFEDFDTILDNLMIDGKIKCEIEEDDTLIFLKKIYNIESNVATKILQLSSQNIINENEVIEILNKIQEKNNLTLDKLQIDSILSVIKHGFSVITGGPGTGKTTLIKVLSKYFLELDKTVLLAAPTGRAAKRMYEATGIEAKTIHRLLEVGQDSDMGGIFSRNEAYPLEADIVIIDEASMIDIFLLNSLLKAIEVGTKLVLVGDENQLPSVGPGNVLLDIISSSKIPTVFLKKIYRQEKESYIVKNAYKVLNGEKIDVSKIHDDFYFINGRDENDIVDKTIRLVSDRLVDKLGVASNEFQVLSPTKKGFYGIDNLNTKLQKGLNKNKSICIQHSDRVFFVGDKVMQVKNNYNIKWSEKNALGLEINYGNGVFNGDVGYINDINKLLRTVEVVYDDNRYVEYTYKELDEIDLAYAITVHKSQGSEYPAVIIILYGGPKMLLTRNILYTAITRAKNCVIVLGRMDTFNAMIENASMFKRRTKLCERIIRNSEDI